MIKRFCLAALLCGLVLMSGCLNMVDYLEAINQTVDKWQRYFGTNDKELLTTMTDIVQASTLYYDEETDSEYLHIHYIGTKQSFVIWYDGKSSIESTWLDDREVTKTGDEAVVTNTVVWHIDVEDLDISIEFMLRLVKQGNKWLICEMTQIGGFQ